MLIYKFIFFSDYPENLLRILTIPPLSVGDPLLLLLSLSRAEAGHFTMISSDKCFSCWKKCQIIKLHQGPQFSWTLVYRVNCITANQAPLDALDIQAVKGVLGPDSPLKLLEVLL